MNIVNEELLTAKQFAAATGLSPQCVYKQMNNRLKPHVKLLNGQKMLRKSAFDVYPPFSDDSTGEQQANNDLSMIYQRLIDEKDSQISILREQLAVKDNQIQELNNRLEEVTTALKNQQSINAIQMQQIEVHAPDPDEPVNKKRGLFGRILKKR